MLLLISFQFTNSGNFLKIHRVFVCACARMCVRASARVCERVCTLKNSYTPQYSMTNVRCNLLLNTHIYRAGLRYMGFRGCGSEYTNSWRRIEGEGGTAVKKATNDNWEPHGTDSPGTYNTSILGSCVQRLGDARGQPVDLYGCLGPTPLPGSSYGCLSILMLLLNASNKYTWWMPWVAARAPLHATLFRDLPCF